MAEVHEQAELGASVEDVWKVVGDFGGFLEALRVPADRVELAGQGIGQTRKILMGAEPTVERLEERDDDAKRLAYSIVSGPFPVTGYLSTMQLSPIGDGRTKLDWSSTFDPAAGTSEEEAMRTVTAVYKAGIAGLQARFGT